MSTEQQKKDFEDQAFHIAHELCEHLSIKTEELLEGKSRGLIGATYQITTAYLLANVVKILRLGNKTDDDIRNILIEGLKESFRLANMNAPLISKEKH